MKRFLKILAIVSASVLLFILLLSISAKLFEDDIAKGAIKQVSKSIDAPIEIGSVNFNLIRGFPKSTIAFSDLWLKSPDKNSTDTIAGIHRLYVSINSRAAMNGRYEVEKIEIDGLTLNYAIDADSLSNIDFLMSLIPESDTTEIAQTDSIPDSTSLYFNLHQFLLKNISCSYFDATSNTGGKINVPEIVLKGNIMGNDYTAETNGNITITDVNFGDYNLQLMKAASLDFHLHYIGDSVRINTFTLKTDGIDISASGLATTTDDIHIDAAINSGKIDIGELSKYIPEELMQEIGLVSAQGVLSFNTRVTGEYNDSTMPQIDAEFSFSDGAFTTTDYPTIKHFSLNGKASNGTLRNNSTTSLDLKDLRVETKSSSFNLTAHVLDIDQPRYKISSKGSVLIDEFTDYIPDSLLESISGRFNWAMGTSGRAPKVIGDDFTDYLMAYTWANLSVQDLNVTMDSSLSIENFSGEMTYHPNNIVVKNLEMKVPSYDVTLKNSSADIGFNGSINNTDAMSCNIRNIHFEMEDNIIDFGATLSNLTQPDYTFDGTMQLSLEQLQKFAPDTLLKAMSGEVTARLSSAGHLNLDSIETQGMALAFENSTLDLECKNVEVIMPDTLMEVSRLNLSMTMKPDTISVPHFSADYKGLTMAINNTQIINAYNTAVLNKKEKLEVITSITIGDIDYALFEPFMTTEDTTEVVTDSIITNYTMDIKGDIAINSFKLDDYEVDSTMTIKHLNITDFSSKFRATDSTYIADSLEFKAFGGHMLTSARYDMKPNNEVKVALRNHTDGMDFKQLLYDMDNFGQTELTSENISGELLSDVNVSLLMIGDSVPMDKFWMRGDFKLTNGRIVDFEAAEELSKFTGIKELDDIQFQTLNSNLFIFAGAAYIPKTTIVNSAVDITFFGKQAIKEEIDEYDYHLEMNLGDVFTGKRDGLMKKQAKADKNADEEVERNGVNLYYGKSDGKIKKGFDRKKSMEAMQRRIRIQERFLNLVFHHDRINYDTNFVDDEAQD